MSCGRKKHGAIGGNGEKKKKAARGWDDESKRPDIARKVCRL